MNSHDVGRGRGGLEAALAAVTARTIVAGIDSDRLYPLYQQQQLARAIAGVSAPRIVSSPYGHDSFLIEVAAVGQLLRELLTAVPCLPVSA
jgi:homoserine O-acetyltransferase